MSYFSCCALVVSSVSLDTIPIPVLVSVRRVSVLHLFSGYTAWLVYFDGSSFDALCVYFADLSSVVSFDVLYPNLSDFVPLDCDTPY